MNIYKHLLALLLVAFATSWASSQSLRAYLTKAEEAYAVRNYSSSLAYYQIILEEESERLDALYYGALSAHYLRSYSLAEEYFERIPEEERTDEYGKTNYWLATVKKSLEKFDEAIELFQQYGASGTGSHEMKRRAKEEIANCRWALDAINKPLKVEVTQLGQHVNTYYSDYGPAIFGDTIYYTSTAKVRVEKGKKKKKKRKKKRSKKKKTSKNVEYKLVTKIFRSINGEEGKAIRQNSRAENTFTANFAMNSNSSRMYYTVCEQLNGGQDFRCDLYYREREAGRDWGRAIELPESINVSGFSATQPAIGWNSETAQEWLFFTSDRPGGAGKMDIWYSIIGTDGEFSEPINLAALNTEADELTPFFDSPSQILYFSSDGRQNLGGYDIFRSVKKGKEWTEAENMGYPVNSSFDEVYYTIDHVTNKAYIASNRAGSLCISPDKDCNLHDIYELTHNVSLLTSAFDENDFSMVYGVKIELEDLTTGQKETFQLADEEYKMELPMYPGRDYRIAVSKEGYSTGYAEINSDEVVEEELPKKYVFMKPQNKMIIRTFDARTRKPLNGMSIRVTDMTDNTTQTLNIPADTYQISFPAKTDRDYQVVGVKSGFDAVTQLVSFKGFEKQSNLTRDLFFEPFFGGLPLAVYFDNNMPAQNMTNATTYTDTYEKYMLKKSEFIDGYTAGLTGIDAELARSQAERFFDSKIQSGYYDLLKLSDNLLFALKRGEQIELALEGYASPLADPIYNEAIANRRIQTLINHFENYKNGVLKPYIGTQLTLKTVPFGENQASIEVSDKVEDKRASVYSPSASEERKVIITGFKTPSSNMSTSLK